MSKQNFSDIVNNVKTAIAQHSPEILTGIGIAGMITTTILAVRATPKAMRLIEHEKQVQKKEKLKTGEVIKTAWKCYIPATITGAVSVACLIGASSVNARRNAALATAYKLSETALAEYKEKVIETIGEKKEQHIREKVDEARIEKNPVSQNNVIITGKGDTLCYDYYSDRYFKSDIEKIKKAVNEINRRLLCDSYISLNEFYDEIGLDGAKAYDRMGWNTDSVKLVELHFSAQISDTGDPCIVIDFEEPPKYDFDKFF